jgi:signal transduction histidine kinase
VILGLFCWTISWLSRRALWESFDADLIKELDVLQSEFVEETSEQHPFPAAGRESAGVTGAPIPADALRRAAQETFAELRLVGISAEFRLGSRAETLLARFQRDPKDSVSIRALVAARVGADGERPHSVFPGYRGVLRRISPVNGAGPITILLVSDTEIVDHSVVAIRNSLAALSFLGLLLALCGGYVLAYRALRPIDSLGRQARLLLEARAVSSHRLQVANESDELGQLASVFNQLLEQLDAALVQMRRFVESAAHELRTPVAVVRGEAELALSRDRSVTEYRDSLNTIAGESVHLSHLVRDLTILADGEVTESPIESRPVDLGEVVDETVRALRGPAEARQVRLEVGQRCRVQCLGDKRLIREILSNLIGNAIKFSPEGSCARIEVLSGASTVEIRVSDQAPAIPHSERGRVFERFYRGAAARSSEIEGSGLGLAIVRWAVERHGGGVRIEPGIPSGNVFIVALPASLT